MKPLKMNAGEKVMHKTEYQCYKNNTIKQSSIFFTHLLHLINDLMQNQGMENKN